MKSKHDAEYYWIGIILLKSYFHLLRKGNKHQMTFVSFAGVMLRFSGKSKNVITFFFVHSLFWLWKQMPINRDMRNEIVFGVCVEQLSRQLWHSWIWFAVANSRLWILTVAVLNCNSLDFLFLWFMLGISIKRVMFLGNRYIFCSSFSLEKSQPISKSNIK